VLIVVEPEHRDALETSPDFATLAEPCRRAERPRRRVSVAIAALDCLAASRGLRKRNPRLNLWPETWIRVPPASFAALRRRSRSPPALPRRRLLARVLDRRIEIRRARSILAAPPLAFVLRRWIKIQRLRFNPPHHLTRTPSQSSDPDLIDLISPARSQLGQLGLILQFCGKPPKFSGIHRYTLPP
jgi:hypothetical protein